MLIAIIQARMGSTRLPGKVFMDIAGKPAIWHVYDRVRKSKLINMVALATTESKNDAELVSFCKFNGIPCYAGSEDDVLDRYYQAARYFGAGEGDSIIRITGDCPLIDPVVIDRVIELYNISDVDYASNVNPPTYPDGLDVEVFRFTALEKAWRTAKMSSEREHVTPYIRNHTEMFKQANLKNETDYSHMRWTLDEHEDFIAIESIYRGLYDRQRPFLMQDIINYLNKNPEITKVNSNYERNEGYAKSLNNDKVVK